MAHADPRIGPKGEEIAEREGRPALQGHAEVHGQVAGAHRGEQAGQHHQRSDRATAPLIKGGHG